jgi:leader peptidase (prepilin peptidase)/N-methyltransferase
MLFLSPGLTAYILLITAVLGLVCGSFADCAAARIAAGQSFLRGRSHCDRCGHVLGPRDLVPVVSWLALKGKCRYCGAKISVRCPLTELLCAAAFVGVVLRYDVTLVAAQYLILTVLLEMVALVDYDTGLIPDELLAAILTDFLVFSPFVKLGGIWKVYGAGLLSGFAAAGPLLLLVLIMDRILRRESMGGGDIKLFFVTGMFFPWQCVLFLLILACLFGIVFALISQKTTGDPENPKAFPFGPAIAAGVYVSLLAAQPAVRAYLNLFLH